MAWKGVECRGLGRRSRSRAGGIAPGFHTALPGNTLFKRVSFFFFVILDLFCSLSSFFTFKKRNLYSLGEILYERSFVSCWQ